MRVLCASMSAPGHAFPMLAVARALASRGHDVTLMSGDEHAAPAARAGAAFMSFPPGIDGSPREALRFYEDATVMTRALLAPLRALDADVIVHDLVTLGPALAAEVLGVPFATVVVHPLPLWTRGHPPFGLGRRLIPVLEANIARNAVRDLARARAELNAARVSLGLAPTERLDATMSAEAVIVGTLPSLDPPRPGWPPQAEVVGPLLWDEPGEDVAVPSGGAPLVLIAPSTSHDQAPLVAAAVDAVARTGARAVLTSGPTAVPPALPEGVVAVPFASHDRLIPACDAVITSGGHGIVARALTRAVPLVIVPGPGDQRENAWRVARVGAGIRVRRPDAARIARALGRVLRDQRIRAAAERLAAEAASLDGAGRAAELIERLAGRAGREDAGRPAGGDHHA